MFCMWASALGLRICVLSLNVRLCVLLLEGLNGFLVDWFGFVVCIECCPHTVVLVSVFCAPNEPWFEYKE